MSDATSALVVSTVEAVVANYLLAATARLEGVPIQLTTNVITTPGQPLEVRVKLKQTVPSMFGQVSIGNTNLNIDSYARVLGKPNLCLLALNPSAMGTIYLEKTAKIVGNECAAYSNSTNPNGIMAFGSSYLTASMICSAGGKTGKANFTPEPLTDCPQFKDPAGGQARADSRPLYRDETGYQRSDNHTERWNLLRWSLDYRQLESRPLARRLRHQDGPFTVDGTASLEGTNVGVLLIGSKAAIKFTVNTTISLSGPSSGPMGGLLIFASRSQTGESHSITSNNAATLTGTIYMPTGSLTVGGNGAIGSAPHTRPSLWIS